MFSRHLTKAAVLAAAAGSPYLASETDFGRGAASSLSDLVSNVGLNEWAPSKVSGRTAGSVQPQDSDRYPAHGHYQVETLRETSSPTYRYEETLARKLGGLPPEPTADPALVGNNITDLRDALRFDLTTRAVLDKFSRVSTVLADLQLEGLRVPIVTGTRADDLAGTLTYYFDRSGMIQRINIHGFTGDPNRLVETLQQYYQVAAEPSLEAGVYTKRWNGIPVHFLRLTHAPVVYSDAVHQKYTVFLELNQPNLTYGISEEARRIVRSDQWTGRW